jgi:hypothetical protein
VLFRKISDLIAKVNLLEVIFNDGAYDMNANVIHLAFE